jgi:hypothetical protein
MPKTSRSKQNHTHFIGNLLSLIEITQKTAFGETKQCIIL